MMSNKNTLLKDWVLVELIDFCIKSKRAIVDGPFGSNLKTEHFKKQGIPVINSSFVTELTFNASEYVYVDDELFQREIRSKVVPGDIVMAKIGARCGSSAILPENHPISILSGNSLKISIDENENSKEFVWYLLINEYLKNQFKDCKSVGAQPAISTPHLKKLKFPKPPLPEQKAIACVLSTADAAIHTTEKLIAKKELRKKWLMQQLLTGKKRLKGFGGEWKEMYLSEMFKERNETKFYKLPLLSIGQNGVYPQEESIKKDTSNEDKSKYKRICPGDIGYNTMRMWQGRSALSELEGIVSPAYTIVTPKKNADSLFFSYLFKMPKMTNLFWRNSQGLVDDTLNCKFKDFSIVKVVLPQTKEEQTAIARVLQAADKEISLLKTKAKKLREQKKGLMQVLLTGKKRLDTN